jgi:proteasome lid subunit RPN8/RPN11
MWQALVRSTRQLFADLSRSLGGERQCRAASRAPATDAPLQALERVVLTDGVGRTLFEEYSAHRAQARGEEETGWILLGLRKAKEAVVLATLPAGAERDASVAHVRFNTSAQALGSRIVRQADRRLNILGVVHTHPGSLRHPSDGDYRGDSEWVRQLRGGEGIFAIGTADGDGDGEGLFASQPRPHMQRLGKLALSWYALRCGDRGYRPLPVGLTLGPDVARPLHPIWSVVEHHADQLERLYRQQAGVTFEPVLRGKVKGLVVNIPLAERGHALRVLLEEDEVRYYVIRGDEVLEVDACETRVDRGTYLLLAELAAQA